MKVLPNRDNEQRERFCQTPHVEQASRNMRDFNIGLLPVIEKGNVLGVITDRDIMEKSHIRRLVVLNRRNQLTGSVNDH